MLALLLAVALGADLDPVPPFNWDLPEPPAPVAQECPEAVDLVVGRPLPPGLVGDDGLVTCYGTVLPTSDLADLLLVDAWARRAVPRGARLVVELGWQEERYARLSAAYDEPTPWLQRPDVQRTIGRIETAAVMLLAVGIVAVLDSEVVR